MKPVNIYSLTRVAEPERLTRLERQMSKRKRFLKIKEWEMSGLKAFCDNLCEVLENAPELDFFYSFTMQKLGKEFDLIRVGADSVVNIELKSGNVSDEVIRNQLIQNRYYLSTLGCATHFYTYVSNDDRLVRLSNSGRLVETDFEELAVTIEEQGESYKGDIEDLFKEENYLISPLTDPGKFLRQEYFLTSQQKDISNFIIKGIKKCEKESAPAFFGFTGLPGTGKTILLYDIAMKLSHTEKVCLLHFGSHLRGLEELDERLKRIDFYYCEEGRDIVIPGEYRAILIDEGHRIDKKALDDILDLSKKWNAPAVFSYDREDAIAPEEREGYGAEIIEELPGFTGYRLTNRIRLNSELSSFINSLMGFKSRNLKHDYPNVRVAYAGNDEEAKRLISAFEKDGFVYIKDNDLNVSGNTGKKPSFGNSYEIDAMEATCKEFERVLMVMDESFCYDENGNLRNAVSLKGEKTADIFKVRKLFHGLSRAKESIALIVKGNLKVLDVILFILQR